MMGETATAWPVDGSPLLFGDLTTPVRKALRTIYRMKARPIIDDIPWTGPPNGKREDVSCFSPQEALTKQALDYDREDQGRDALDVLLGIAVRLGIEQGRRIFKTSPEYTSMVMRLDLIESVARPAKPNAL